MWLKLASVLLFGYVLDGRSFAYLGFPSYHVYISEVCLGLLLVCGPRTSRLLRERATALYFLLGSNIVWGLIQVWRGLSAEYPPVLALRDCAFNYYPLFILLGLWVALRDDTFLVKFVRSLAWLNGLYGIAFILFLNRNSWIAPGTSAASSIVPVFSQTGGSALVLLGLIAFERNWSIRTWLLAAINLLVMLGLMVRSEWVGFLAGLLAFGFCTGRLRQIAVGIAGVAALVALLYLVDFRIPAPLTRGGGELSAEAIAARALATLDTTEGSEFAQRSGVDAAAGDIFYRTQWWAAIWNEVNSDPIQALAGFGYGYPIADLSPSITPGTIIRTPHNDFIYALGYSGWVGVTIFTLVQLEIALLLFRAFQISGQAFGLMYWAMILSGSCFGNVFENPFGAIPFYLLVGIAIVPALSRVTEETGRAPHGSLAQEDSAWDPMPKTLAASEL